MGSLLSRLAEIGGKRMPFLRWSFVRFLLGARNLLKVWQVGDGREDAVLEYVLANARPGDLDAIIAAIDAFAYKRKFLINVGDEKGLILDEVIERAKPVRVLELGAYVGYSALRIARKLPRDGHLYSIEFSAENATIARRVIEHAGVSDKVTVIVGYLGDGGTTMEALAKHGLAAGNVGVVFLDHHKDAYLPDLERILTAGWITTGSVVIADNIGFPGSPLYKAYIEKSEGVRFRTEKHRTYAEYQTLIPDIVLVSTLL